MQGEPSCGRSAPAALGRISGVCWCWTDRLVGDVHLGTHRLEHAPVLVADLPVFDAFGVSDRPAVILGMAWLESTRMVIDFPAALVWFESVHD